MTCERCGHGGWLFLLDQRRLCSACWDVEATDAAIARGDRKIDPRQKRRVVRT